MDIHLQGNSPLHYGLNGAARPKSRPGEDDAMLTREEKECLQFFQNTIESLEESLTGDDQRSARGTHPGSSRGPADRVSELPMMSPNPRISVSSHQDIIDLVHPEPDLVRSKEPMFNPINPDFPHMVPTPERHFEVKPKHDNLSSEYDSPLPSGSSSYHPAGSVPTPVLIAQRIAENQGDGTAHLHPSTLLRRLSMESEKSPSNTPNVQEKHGPPTPTKSYRYPPNINMNLSCKEQPKPVANVNIHERQEQMLANLSTAHPLVQDNSEQVKEQKGQNTPSRSISFKDPAPDKSRMEALSKLGLNRSRATSFHNTSDNTSLGLYQVPETRDRPPQVNLPPTTQNRISSPEPSVMIPPSFHTDRKTEMLQTHSLQNHEERNFQENPSSPTITQNLHYTPPPAEVASLEFNNYGGKSIIVHPSVSSKPEPATVPANNDHKNLPSALCSPAELNPYGGKTKVMTPAHGTRNNLPDILSSHIDKNQTTSTKLEPQQAELNSYGGKSRSINPTGPNRSVSIPTKSPKPPPPAPAPKPSRHSYHGVQSPQKTQRALSPDPSRGRRSTSMFRPQGITVQFCGRGAMNESRREALRKLGLLKDS